MGFFYKNEAYTVKIQPALIEQKEGSYKAFFPSMTEEVVEEAIKKIFSDLNCRMHNVNKSESWVRFSLRMIYAELKKVGKTRNITEIKQAIEVMSSCLITLYQNNKEVWKGAIYKIW